MRLKFSDFGAARLRRAGLADEDDGVGSLRARREGVVEKGREVEVGMVVVDFRRAVVEVLLLVVVVVEIGVVRGRRVRRVKSPAREVEAAILRMLIVWSLSRFVTFLRKVEAQSILHNRRLGRFESWWDDGAL